jgi:hypothetical protein
VTVGDGKASEVKEGLDIPNDEVVWQVTALRKTLL